MTIFDISSSTLCVVLFIFCAMNLYILKETVLVFASEATLEPGALSKLLDKKLDANRVSSNLRDT